VIIKEKRRREEANKQFPQVDGQKYEKNEIIGVIGGRLEKKRDK
jgi:hypothetical protein